MARSASVLPRYLNNNESARKTVADGWLMTGGFGEMDAVDCIIGHEAQAFAKTVRCASSKRHNAAPKSCMVNAASTMQLGVDRHHNRARHEYRETIRKAAKMISHKIASRSAELAPRTTSPAAPAAARAWNGA